MTKLISVILQVDNTLITYIFKYFDEWNLKFCFFNIISYKTFYIFFDICSKNMYFKIFYFFIAFFPYLIK